MLGDHITFIPFLSSRPGNLQSTRTLPTSILEHYTAGIRRNEMVSSRRCLAGRKWIRSCAFGIFTIMSVSTPLLQKTRRASLIHIAGTLTLHVGTTPTRCHPTKVAPSPCFRTASRCLSRNPSLLLGTFLLFRMHIPAPRSLSHDLIIH